MHRSARRLVFGLAVFCSASSLLAADWSRFRGPNGSGEVADPAVPLEWTRTRNVAWKTELPGTGNSSPIVVKGVVYLQAASKDGAKRMLVAVDAASGAIKWAKEMRGRTAKTHKKNSLASSSCGSDGERVFTPVWDGTAVTLFAHDLDGNELWTASLGTYASQHGPGMSPVPFNGNVYLNFDQDGASEFLCFDAKTGAKKWAAPRKPFRASYSSPVVREVDGGKTEIVIASTAGVTGYDPETGKVNWDYEWKFDGMALRNVGSPVLAKDVVLAISGDGSGARSMVAVRPGPPAKLLWQKSKETPYVPCPLVKGDHVYWIHDGGFAICAEIGTGKVVWNERLFQKAVSASPLMVGDTIFAVAEDGKAAAFKASPDGLDKVGESDVGEPVFASPAVADGKLFIRGTTSLFCIGKK